MTPLQRDAFLKVLARTGKVDTAAQRAGIPRSTVYRHREVDGSFARQWDEALGRAAPRAAPATPPGCMLPVQQMTPEQRRLGRAFLDSLAANPPGSAQSQAQAALERWLAGQPWPMLDAAAVDELRLLSSRAHVDYLTAHATGAPPSRDLPTVLGGDIAEQQ